MNVVGTKRPNSSIERELKENEENKDEMEEDYEIDMEELIS